MLERPVLETRVVRQVKTVPARLMLRTPSLMLLRWHRPTILSAVRVVSVMQFFVVLILRPIVLLTVLVTKSLLVLLVKSFRFGVEVLSLRSSLFGLVVLVTVVSILFVLLARLLGKAALGLRCKVLVSRHCRLLCLIFCQETFVARVGVLCTAVLDGVPFVCSLHLGLKVLCSGVSLVSLDELGLMVLCLTLADVLGTFANLS